MTERILGPTGSKRRRRFLWVPMLLVACTALFVIAGAQAVHNAGFFQLDGDGGVTQHSYVGSTVGGAEDWDNVCAAHLQVPNVDNSPGPYCHPVNASTLPSATIAERSAFITDAFIAATDNIYKGGTDDQDINQTADGLNPNWQWKEAGPSPDKADIEQAFAAQYTCTQALVDSGKCINAYKGHRILYFGGTRLANVGDTNIGLWFFHSPVTVGGLNTTTDATTGATRCLPASGCGFSGQHTAGNCSLPHTGSCNPGDLFVQSAFTSKPSIKVFEWVGAGNATKDYNGTNGCITSACTLQPVPLPAGASGDNKCEATGTVNDTGCAIVNDAATVGGTGTTAGQISSKWLFTDKGKAPANTFNDSELFEGGLDLTSLGFGDECISTVLLNTRSSGSSVNSVAQDFALGSFGSCESTVSTVAALNANGTTIDNGTTVANGTASSGTDSATVTVSGIATWGGTLEFRICGPFDAPAVCDANGVLVSSKTISQSTDQTNGISSFVDANNPGTAKLTSAGRYCWFAKFTPDTATVAKGVKVATDDGSGSTPNKECFTVAKVTPLLPTTAGTSPVSFGSAVTDTAALSGAAKEPGHNGTNQTYNTINATNGAFAGQIGFTLKGPDDPATPLVKNCSTNATAYTGETQTFPINVSVTGNGTIGPVSFKPGAPGTYHWVAVYNGPGANGTAVNNNLPQTYNGTCSDANEDVIVQRISTTTKTVQSWVPNDSATIAASATGGNTLSGTIRFQLFPNSTCAGTTTLYDNTFGSTASPLTAGTDGKIHQDSANTTVIHKADGAAGGYPNVSWLVTFTPVNDPSHTGSTNSCDEQSVLTITDSP